MAANNDSYILGLFLDFETGGLSPQDCAITQIALHAVRLDTFEKLGAYVRYIQPYYRKDCSKRKKLKSKYEQPSLFPMEYTEEALKVTGITMDILYDQGIPLETAADEVLQFISDMRPKKVKRNSAPILIGQNIAFDEGFLTQMFEYTGKMSELAKLIRGAKDWYGNWHPTMCDTITLGQLALCNNPDISSYKLELMCERLGIELNDAHDADADVEATVNVAALLTKRMRQNCDNNADDGIQLNANKAEKTRKHFKI